ncbi:unnamed protein product [Sphagnum jensenii]|uniref:Patatin n=1 Tax=Sphagnum jensenii TaxID=128206 RepID=A0ABP1BIX1_9BRYO
MAENFKAAQPKGSTGKRLTILSIDGGGVRGIIPAVQLAELEKKLQRIDKSKDRRVAEYFDLIVGTSTGGLITAMITIPCPATDGTNIHPRSAAEVVDFYEQHAAEIFPPVGTCYCTKAVEDRLKTGKDLLRPRYDPENLNKLLHQYCGNRKLSEARTNVIIPSFDIKRQQPVFFSSWEAKRNPLENPPLKLVCRASTAAPTYLPAVQFHETRQFNMVDGGVAVNNPTYVGITQAVKEVKLGGPCAERATYENFSDLLVLSLGTGSSPTPYSAKDAAKWGALKWVLNNGSSPLINSAFAASADMVDYNLSIMFHAHDSRQNYLRIQTYALSGTLAELDNATAQNLKDLKTLGCKLLDELVSERDPDTGKIIRNPNVTNRDALHRYCMYKGLGDCLVLSLGTGQHEREYSATIAAEWGVKNWLRYDGDVPLLSFLQNASADMVDYNLCTLVDDHKSAYDDAHQFLDDNAKSYRNYLRIQVPLLICVSLTSFTEFSICYLRACDSRLPGEEFLKTCKELFRPRYNPQTLDELLEDYCGNRTLSEALTNVIIPSFDIERQSPVLFSSWEPTLKAALVKDVCRATTAAPTFLPPVYFTVPPTEDKKKKDHTKKDPQTQAVGEILHFNMIDGGIAVNNPTYVGVTQAMRHFSRGNPVKEMAYQNFSNFLVLSLGTGQHRTRYLAKDAVKWGVINWLRHYRDVPLFSCLENASADMVDYNLSMMFNAHKSDHKSDHNYLRIQTNISPELSKLDDSKNLEKLMSIGEKLLTEQNVFKFTFKTWEIVTTRTPEKIKHELDRFAIRLSNLRKMRPPIIF